MLYQEKAKQARKNATSLEWFVISVKKKRPSKMCDLNTQNYWNEQKIKNKDLIQKDLKKEGKV